jgi:hypothetical protein
MPSYDYSFQASLKNMAPIILEDVIATKDIPYKNVVGNLMHVMVCTRPNLAYLVSRIYQFMNNPEMEHRVATKRILGYIKGTFAFGITYDFLFLFSFLVIINHVLS